MAKKSTIINVTVDTTINTAYVTYNSGTEKLYPADKMPKTVKAWLEAHQAEADPEPEEDPVNMSVEAMKQTEEFAQTVLSLPAGVQSKAWDKIGEVLTPEELHTAQLYVGSYHLMTDRSFYNTVRDSLAEQMWNEMHQEPESDPVSVEETTPVVEEPVVSVEESVVQAPPAVVEAVVPAVVEKTEPEKLRLRWLIPVIPYVAAYNVIQALILIINTIMVVADIGSAFVEVMTDYKKDVAALISVMIKAAVKKARAFKLWWNKSMAWRAELVEEWREPEWI